MIELKNIISIFLQSVAPFRTVVEWGCLYNGIESKIMIAVRNFYHQAITVNLRSGGDERFILVTNQEIKLDESRFTIKDSTISTIASACFYKNRDLIGGFALLPNDLLAIAQKQIKALFSPGDKLFIELTAANKTTNGIVEISTGLKANEGFSFDLPLSNYAVGPLVNFEIITVGGSIVVIEGMKSEWVQLWGEFSSKQSSANVNKIKPVFIREMNKIGIKMVDFTEDICAVI